jgi:hypothetical protein
MKKTSKRKFFMHQSHCSVWIFRKRTKRKWEKWKKTLVLHFYFSILLGVPVYRFANNVTEEPVCTCCFCLSLHRHASSWPPMTNLPERFNNSETLLLSEGSGGTRRWAFQGQGWYQCSLFINSKGISLWLAAKSGG